MAAWENGKCSGAVTDVMAAAITGRAYDNTGIDLKSTAELLETALTPKSHNLLQENERASPIIVPLLCHQLENGAIDLFGS